MTLHVLIYYCSSNRGLYLYCCNSRGATVVVANLRSVIPTAYTRKPESCIQCVTSHRNESCHIKMPHVTQEWVVSHMNASCHIWMRRVTYEVRHFDCARTKAGIMRWILHVTYEWVCHIWSPLFKLCTPTRNPKWHTKRRSGDFLILELGNKQFEVQNISFSYF